VKTVNTPNFIHNVMFRFIFHVTTVPFYVRLNSSFVNDVTVRCAQWTTAHPPVTQGAGPRVQIADVRLGLRSRLLRIHLYLGRGEAR
jgi:hypothetical protein